MIEFVVRLPATALDMRGNEQEHEVELTFRSMSFGREGKGPVRGYALLVPEFLFEIMPQGEFDPFGDWPGDPQETA